VPTVDLQPVVAAVPCAARFAAPFPWPAGGAGSAAGLAVAADAAPLRRRRDDSRRGGAGVGAHSLRGLSAGLGGGTGGPAVGRQWPGPGVVAVWRPGTAGSIVESVRHRRSDSACRPVGQGSRRGVGGAGLAGLVAAATAAALA